MTIHSAIQVAARRRPVGKRRSGIRLMARPVAGPSISSTISMESCYNSSALRISLTTTPFMSGSLAHPHTGHGLMWVNGPEPGINGHCSPSCTGRMESCNVGAPGKAVKERVKAVWLVRSGGANEFTPPGCRTSAYSIG
ncbi:hypothetical protein M0657_003069 [Pyricularia oryzae]|uniref:Uncharacterized protein n=1 Tax=Pyricularia oryzae TaxID=318829 RepID=A0A4P7N9V3_PYROR|nr:hypothetical protein MCOR20_011143 [Pyricularia oryzae]KAI6423721.1 hypothetical protein MCOR22_011298 [Pyricularia oryzae]KAI6483358.1 hypothetical protein MCOR11_010603 [Pyricularia oryzae]KAI7927667.1 hypothetical protein M0657_003069 [Pyricularia oryzae]KAI7930622.1 hypothetical protein M9X92_000686 [Pyricularia oryzae]